MTIETLVVECSNYFLFFIHFFYPVFAERVGKKGTTFLFSNCLNAFIKSVNKI